MNLIRCLSRKQQSATIATLVAVQFLHMTDFIVLMPLGPRLMEHFSISPQQFALLVSSYSIGAVGGGIFGAFFIDRFDRKNAYLASLLGFSIATLVCALSPSYGLLLAGRMVAGMFGTVMESLAYTIIGDGFPEDRRAGATGKLLAGTALAMVVGVPGGLALANAIEWYAAFLLVAGVSAFAFCVALMTLTPMTDHRLIQKEETVWQGVRELLRFRVHRQALVCTGILMLATFSIPPYLASYCVLNLGVRPDELPMMYAISGICVVFSTPLAGWLADRYGQRRIFTVFALTATMPMLIVTHLPPLPWYAITPFSTSLMIAIMGYYSAAMALILSSVNPAYRGRFMSMDTIAEQAGMVVATLLTGMLVGRASDGSLIGFNFVGALAVVAAFIAIVLFRTLVPARTATRSAGESLVLRPEDAQS